MSLNAKPATADHAAEPSTAPTSDDAPSKSSDISNPASTATHCTTRCTRLSMYGCRCARAAASAYGATVRGPIHAATRRSRTRRSATASPPAAARASRPPRPRPRRSDLSMRDERRRLSTRSTPGVCAAMVSASLRSAGAITSPCSSDHAVDDAAWTSPQFRDGRAARPGACRWRCRRPRWVAGAGVTATGGRRQWRSGRPAAAQRTNETWTPSSWRTSRRVYSCDLMGRTNFSYSLSFIGRFCHVSYV